MVLSRLLMGSCVLCVLVKLAGQTTGGWTLTDWSRQGTLSIMWSIHREAAVQLISLDKEKQTLVQCWRAHYYAPNFKEVGGAYCFWVVRPSVLPSVRPSVRHAF